MSTVAKILVVVNLALAAVFVGSASNFLGQQDNWKVKHDTTEATLKGEISVQKALVQKKDNEIEGLRLQGQELQTKNSGLEKEAAAARDLATRMTQAYENTSTQLTTATDAVRNAQSTLEANRQLIDALQTERTALAEAKATALEAKEAAVRTLNEKEIQFENLLAQKQTLEARVTQLQSELNSARLTAETAVARASGGGDVPMDQPAHTGQILDVDNQVNVVVISLGSEDGVRPGFRYTVSRGSQFVGIVEITDVQAKQSAGRAIRDLQKAMPQRGDRVMSR